MVETAHTELPAAPEAKQPALPGAGSSPPAAPFLTRRELLMFVTAALSIAVIAVTLLIARAARSAPSAAATSPSEAAAAAASEPSRSPAPAASHWTSEHASQWLGNRRHSAAFELPADNIVSIWLGRVRPILVVRCADKKMETFVFTGSAIQIEPRTEDHTVAFAFDGGAQASERWPDSAEHDALFARDGAAFAARLTHARTLTFGYTPHNAAPVVATFQVSGLAPLLEPVARECGATPR